MRILLVSAALVGLTACTTTRQSERRAIAAADWRSVATPSDAKRLRDWRSVFAKALQQARTAGHGGEIDAAGRLLALDAAIPGALANGNYRCRIIKLGAQGPGLLDYIAYPAFDCRVTQDGPVQYFAKLTGSQRPMGRIYRADDMRSVFLGVLTLGDETRPMRYGGDPERGLAGWVEHIDAQRWRIIFPSPRFESNTDIIELVPAA